jgi:hypothetical protein
MMHGCAAAVPRSNVKFLGPINPTEAAPRQAKLEAARPIVVGDTSGWAAAAARPCCDIPTCSTPPWPATR